MRIPQNRLFVEVSQEYNDKYDFNGGELYAPQEWGWKKRRICFGTVIAVPDKMTDDMKALDNYYGHSYKDIVPTVKVGDKVYFYGHYNNPNNWINEPDLLQNPKNKLLNLDYEAVICYVREGNMQVVGSHILLSPIKESEESIKTASGLYIKPNAEKKELEGLIERIAEPLACYKELLWSADLNDYVVKEGSRVFITTYADYTMNIEGNDYYVCRQTDIVCVVVASPENKGTLKPIFLGTETKIAPFGYHCIVEHLNSIEAKKNGIILNPKLRKKQEGTLVRVIEVSEHCEVAEKGKVYRAVDKLFKVQGVTFLQEQFLQDEILDYKGDVR